MGNEGKQVQLLWGRQPVVEALASGMPVKKILLQEKARGEAVANVLKDAAARDIEVKRVGKEELEQKAPGKNHQGILAEVGSYHYFEVEDLLEEMRSLKTLPFLLLLDHIQDPHNLGAILRTASACGVDGVILPRDRACGITPAVYKGSAGALAYVPVARAVNLSRETERLKKEGFWIIGADMKGEAPFYETDFNLPLALVLGSEGRGLSRLLKEKCDLLVNIPLGGGVSSLNVSVAAAIILYEVFRQRLSREA